MTTTMLPGTRIQTNEAFGDFILFKETLPWRGVLVERFPMVEGCWVVSFDRIPVHQYINEEFFEKERPCES